MKIFIIPVDKKFQPDHQNYVWPPTNQQPNEDRGVEQDFYEWLQSHPELLVDDPIQADWLYVPIFFNRIYINTPDSDGHWGGGEEELSEEIDKILRCEMPTFTISEADEKYLYPKINWKNLIVFCASRRDENGGIDIPLLCGPHPLPEVIPPKRYLASFLGNLETDGIRIDMAEELKNRKDCRVENANEPPEVFTEVMLESYIALCPRGQGAQSYRMYESLGLGIPPLYISDIDCRPFKKWIDWNKCSFWLKDTKNLSTYLDGLWISYGDDLRIKGQNARYMYEHYLMYQQWCPFVIRELESM
jgi:hypothetical protein